MANISFTVGTVLDGRYRITRQIGEGNMAVVYGAEQLGVGREVAVKVIRQELASDPTVLARFRREIEAVARILSPHVIELYDAQSVTLPVYFVTELIQGETLRSRLARDPMPTHEVLAVVSQLGWALESAHAVGVTHRDLKPDNIFYCEGGTPLSPYVKVIDFGLAKLSDAADGLQLTARQMTVGTPAYLPPEMIVEERVPDSRSDLYSLGVIVYEMLVRELPYKADRPVRMAMAHARDPIPSAHAAARHLPPAIDSFFQIALAKNADDRFQDAATFARALATALGDRRS